MSRIRAALAALTLACALAAPSLASAASPKWTPCFRAVGPFQCAARRCRWTTRDLRGATHQDRHDPAAGDRPGAPHRLALPEPGRAGRVRRGLRRSSAGQQLYTDEVRARFDLVGFDPRGIVRSTPLRCFNSDDRWTVFAAVRVPH